VNTNNLVDNHDPLWPSPSEPSYVEALGHIVDSWSCSKCGSVDVDEKSLADTTLCNSCYTNQAQNSALAKKTNADWMEQSVACGLALYERQPEETTLEWMIWDKYRAHYPMKMPNWTELAAECGCAVGTVVNAQSKWSFKVRIQHWARTMDDTMQEQRAKDVTEMNERQVGMAKVLQDKLKTAIDNLQPELLRPGEIVALLKASTELERRIQLSAPEKVTGTALDAGTKQQQLTEAKDINEVVDILARAGMLGNGMTLGIKTTEIVMKENT
jgi:hypothetical protein